MPRSKYVKQIMGSFYNIYYFGNHQGMQVKLRGVKYPRKRGYVYTTLSALHALESATREAAGLDPRCEINKLDVHKNDA